MKKGKKGSGNEEVTLITDVGMLSDTQLRAAVTALLERGEISVALLLEGLRRAASNLQDQLSELMGRGLKQAALLFGGMPTASYEREPSAARMSEIDAAVGTVAARRAEARKPAKTKLMSPEQFASKQLQGRYLAMVRQFSQRRRDYFAKVAKEKGRKVAMEEMQREIKGGSGASAKPAAVKGKKATATKKKAKKPTVGLKSWKDAVESVKRLRLPSTKKTMKQRVKETEAKAKKLGRSLKLPVVGTAPAAVEPMPSGALSGGLSS